MVDAFDWGLLIVAASGTICAILALIKVMGITNRAEAFLNALPKNPLKIVTTDFAAEALRKTLTGGLAHEDGSPVAIGDMIGAYMDKYGPVMMDRFQAQLPSLIPVFLKAQAEINASLPQGPSPGQQLAGQRWGTPGGLKAAKVIGKATGTSGIVDKIQSASEIVQAVSTLAPQLKEIKETIGWGAGNGGGGSPVPSTGPSHSGEVWTPQ